MDLARGGSNQHEPIPRAGARPAKAKHSQQTPAENPPTRRPQARLPSNTATPNRHPRARTKRRHKYKSAMPGTPTPRHVTTYASRNASAMQARNMQHPTPKAHRGPAPHRPRTSPSSRETYMKCRTQCQDPWPHVRKGQQPRAARPESNTTTPSPTSPNPATKNARH
jgi:hypothetical protein